MHSPDPTFAPQQKALPNAPIALGLSTLAFIVLVILNELMPFAFGTGRFASLPWAFPYVTLRFVLLPVASLALLPWSAIEAFRWFRYRHAPLWLIALSVAIPIGFLALSFYVPLPWFWVAIYGTSIPPDSPGWFR